MSPAAIILLIVSAFIHAGWNLLSKRQEPSSALFFTATLAGTVFLLPIPIFFSHSLYLIPTTVRLLLLLTGFFLAAYYTALAGAYRRGDLSLVYPLARSSPVIVVTFVSFVLGRGHEIGHLSIFGILLIVGGCFLLPLRHFGNPRFGSYLNWCSLLALTAAVGTAGYTIVDDRALAIMRHLAGGAFSPLSASLVYIFFQACCVSLWLGIFVVFTRSERTRLAAIFKDTLKPSIVMGLGIYLAYLLVLVSMAYVSNVSYVAAFRQLSIPLGAAMGMAFLGETPFRPKLAGIAVITIGLILVGIG